MARANPKTENLELPLSTAGVVALQNSYRASMLILDDRIATLEAQMAALLAAASAESNSTLV